MFLAHSRAVAELYNAHGLTSDQAASVAAQAWDLCMWVPQTRAQPPLSPNVQTHQMQPREAHKHPPLHQLGVQQPFDAMFISISCNRDLIKISKEQQIVLMTLLELLQQAQIAN